jgi:hypothetical protein
MNSNTVFFWDVIIDVLEEHATYLLQRHYIPLKICCPPIAL